MRPSIILSIVIRMGFLASLCGASTLAATLASAGLLAPQVHVGDVLSYRSLYRIGPPINEVRSSSDSYTIASVKSDGSMNVTLTDRHGSKTLDVDAAGGLLEKGRPSQALGFFLARQILGDPPADLTVGTTWSSKLALSNVFGPPGVATFTVNKIDTATGDISLRIQYRGVGVSMAQAPGDTHPTRFRTRSEGVGEIDLRHGIIQHVIFRAEDHQQPGDLAPLDVSRMVEITRTR